jgi:hypothetical protein
VGSLVSHHKTQHEAPTGGFGNVPSMTPQAGGVHRGETYPTGGTVSVRMSGHLFITQGDLTKLACDAWIVPTDATGKVIKTWWAALGEPSLAAHAEVLRTAGAVTVRPRTRNKPAIVAVNSGAGRKGPAWYADQLITAVELAMSEADAGKPLCGRDRPLIGVPIVGVGAGGGRAFRGDIVRAEVERLLAFVASSTVDIALVTYSHQMLSAAQAARRLLGDERTWTLTSDQVQQARRLAELARAGKLVLFLGSGLSKPAGLPLWNELLARLVKLVKPQPNRKEFNRLDVLDQAEIVRRELGEERFRAEIRARFDGDTQALGHQLLAPLPVHEAATTNYDRLFEDAWRAVEQDGVAALPEQSPNEARRWVLKLHGSVTDDDPKRELVLCREDYLRLGDQGAALKGVVQAMLLTRHMLFVGFSLTDDTFHKIAHDVRSVLGAADKRPSGEPFGTALTLRTSRLAQQLWDGDITLVPVEGPRQFELFLDRLLYETANPLSLYLDPTFAGLLTGEEAAAARDLQQAVDRLPGAGGAALRERLGLS